MADDDLIESLCIVLHDAYETAAAEAGWETQADSRKPWADVPEANRVTMRASVRALLAADPLRRALDTPSDELIDRIAGQVKNGRYPLGIRGDIAAVLAALDKEIQ